MMDKINEAIDIVGGQEELAKKTGVSQCAVSKWSRGGQISAENARKVEKATLKRVKAIDLRPDIFGGLD